MGWYLTPGAANAGATGPRVPKVPKPHLPPKPRAPVRPPAPVDPFAPQSDAQLQARASSQGSAGLAPIIKQITDAINQRSASGQQAISGLTQSLGGLFSQAAPATAAAYGQAQGEQSAINSQLANRLGAYGTNLAGQQGASLASINAPQATGAMTAQTAQTGTGAANAGFAQGNAEIGSLIAHGANAGAYAAQMPGIAGLTGLQNSKMFQAQLNHELGQQLSAAQAQAAQNVATTYNHLKDLEFQKAQATRLYGQSSAKLAVDAAYKQAQLNYQQAKSRWQKQVALLNAHTGQQRAGTGQQNANTAAQRAAAAQQNALNNQKNQNANYYTDAQGRRVPKGYQYSHGRLTKIPTGKGGGVPVPPRGLRRPGH